MSLKRFLLPVVAFFFVATNGAAQPITAGEHTRVQTVYGPIEGYQDGQIFTFKGIPYAKAERFMAPQKPDAFTEVRQCKLYGPQAPQNESLRWNGRNSQTDYGFGNQFVIEPMDEAACLVLNVWTPSISDKKKRPVFVWIHGGGYAGGSGHDLPCYEGRALAEAGDIVVVNLNHRLNILGYIDLTGLGGKYSQSVNLGQQDIVAALRWVKENIAYFGGDPNCVTIFGQSGGGGKVSTLLCMPSAKGLFQRAMIMSGSFLGSTPQESAREVGEFTAWYLGLTTSTIDSIQRVPYEKLLEAANKASREVGQRKRGQQNSRIRLGWGPVNDGAVMPGIFENGSERISKDIPLLIGSTLNEFSTPNVDQMVRPAVIQQATIRCQEGDAPVYVYLSGYQTPTLDGNNHACHNSDIPFFFNNVLKSAQMTGATKEGLELGDKMSSALINFARTGNPNAKGLPKWPAFTPETEATMYFDAPKCRITTKTNP